MVLGYVILQSLLLNQRGGRASLGAVRSVSVRNMGRGGVESVILVKLLVEHPWKHCTLCEVVSFPGLKALGSTLLLVWLSQVVRLARYPCGLCGCVLCGVCAVLLLVQGFAS